MSKIISRNTVLPSRKTQNYNLNDPNQKTTSIRIFEGERPMVQDNHKLGEFQLSGFPGGRTDHEVSFEVNADGMLTITASIAATGDSKSLVITNAEKKLTEEEITRMM